MTHFLKDFIPKRTTNWSLVVIHMMTFMLSMWSCHSYVYLHCMDEGGCYRWGLEANEWRLWKVWEPLNKTDDRNRYCFRLSYLMKTSNADFDLHSCMKFRHFWRDFETKMAVSYFKYNVTVHRDDRWFMSCHLEVRI